ncbi:MAG: hypothetical protein M3Z04_13095 [Chloroflexota bacterium]|nr:hypothetical protein [Chloroflexota bacterium]
MSDHNTHDPNNQAEGATPQHNDQTWREERHQPEPKAIEGLHAGQHVPEDLQRHERHDTGVGAVSRVAGDDEGSGRGAESGLATGSHYGTSGDSTHQGSTSTPGGHTDTAHAGGQGRNTEGAFGEEQARDNASPLNDFRDAGISKREIGAPGPGDRTQGGTQ